MDTFDKTLEFVIDDLEKGHKWQNSCISPNGRVTGRSYSINSSENKMDTKFCEDISKAIHIEKFNPIFLNMQWGVLNRLLPLKKKTFFKVKNKILWIYHLYAQGWQNIKINKQNKMLGQE